MKVRTTKKPEKDIFSQFDVGSYDDYREAGGVLPHIVLMIDNLSAMKEVVPEYEDAVLNVCREGLVLGITVFATAKQTGLSYRYMSKFPTRLRSTVRKTVNTAAFLTAAPSVLKMWRGGESFPSIRLCTFQ